MADPFDLSTQDPNSPGMFGLPASTWQDIARFGANLAQGANARTASGHLANGTGFAGPVGAAVTATMDAGRQNALARSLISRQGAETQGLGIQNQLAALGLPFARALSQAQLGALQKMQGGGQVGGPSGVGPDGLGAAEGGSNPAAVNSAGYSGQYQFGAPRLAELGLYQPAEGEPLNSNKWTGQFNIPGFPDVKTQKDFLGNQQAQNTAYQIHMGNIDQAIQGTPGAAQMDPNGLRAVAHLGGVHGMQQFVATGGQYNPADSNGTHLSDYYQRFSGQGAASPASGPRVQAPGSYQVAQAGGAPTMAPQGQPTQSPTPIPGTPDARAAAQRLRSEASGLVQQANQAALLGHGLMGDPAILRQSAMEKTKLADQLDTAGPMEAAKGAAGLPSKLAGEGFQQGPGGTQKVIPGGKADPGYIGQVKTAEANAQLGVQLAQKGFVLGSDGNMTPIPGGPADPNYVGAKAAAEKEAEAQVTLRTVGQIEAAKTNAGVPARLAEKGFRQGPGGTQEVIPGSAADPGYIGQAEKAKADAEAMASRLKLIGTRSGIYDPLMNQGRGGEAYRQPEYEHIIEPSTGIPYAAFITPDEQGNLNVMGGPPGFKAGQPAATGLGPGQTEAMKASSEDAFGEKARAQYAAAQGTKKSMRDLDRQFEVLNSQGPDWYNTGAGAEWKLALGRGINAATATAGAPPIFDPDKIAAGEDIVKQSKLAGMDVLAQHFGGSREAASIISGTQKAVPNIENTPLGGKLMLNGYQEAANWVSDQHAFNSNWYISHKGNMVGADVAFSQSHPAEKYQDRAISAVRPFAVRSFEQAKDFLPGTRIILKGGNPNIVKVVPGGTDVQFVDPQNPQGAPNSQGTLNGQ